MLLRGGRHPFPVAGRKPPVRLREDALSPLFLHPSLLSVVEKATAYDAKDRYAEIGQFADDVRGFMSAYDVFLDEVIPMTLFAPHSTFITNGTHECEFSDVYTSVVRTTTPTPRSSSPFDTETSRKTDRSVIPPSAASRSARRPWPPP